MWSIEVEAPVEGAYVALKQEFTNQHITEVEVGEPAYKATITDPAMQAHFASRGPAKQNQADPGVSEQWRCCGKAVQSLLENFSGNVRVTIQGTPGSELNINVEAIP